MADVLTIPPLLVVFFSMLFYYVGLSVFSAAAVFGVGFVVISIIQRFLVK